MHVVVQIPCLNESATIAEVIAAVPRRISGVDRVSVLIIDDGSTDGTLEAAFEAGADYALQFESNQGLAAAFVSGLAESQRLGADIIVNTDGDHQYPGSQIPALVAPIAEGRADAVFGVRKFGQIPHFSPMKRFLQRFGSLMVSLAAGVRILDATTGFRAFSRETAEKIFLTNNYTYTLESAIRLGRSGARIEQTPIDVNPPTRESRLIKSIFKYIRRGAGIIVGAGLTANRRVPDSRKVAPRDGRRFPRADQGRD